MTKIKYFRPEIFTALNLPPFLNLSLLYSPISLKTTTRLVLLKDARTFLHAMFNSMHGLPGILFRVGNSCSAINAALRFGANKIFAVSLDIAFSSQALAH